MNWFEVVWMCFGSALILYSVLGAAGVYRHLWSRGADNALFDAGVIFLGIYMVGIAFVLLGGTE